MEEYNSNDDKLNKFEKIIKDSYHPTTDELGNYILFQNGIDPEDKSILRLIPKIELHLRKCTDCNNLFLELNNEYSELDNFLNYQQHFKIDSKSEQRKVPVMPLIKAPVKYFKYSGIFLAMVCILYLGGFSVSRLITPASLNYAYMENISEFYETRGLVTSDDTSFYSYYVMGLTYLESAQSDILGLFPSYDKIKVNKGIAALKKSMELNNSGKFRNINLDIYFYLAKADLMLNNVTEAKENLKKVVAEKGSNMNEAKKILSGLE